MRSIHFAIVGVCFLLPACNSHRPVAGEHRIDAPPKSEVPDESNSHNSTPRVDTHESHDIASVEKMTHDAHVHANHSHGQLEHPHAQVNDHNLAQKHERSAEGYGDHSAADKHEHAKIHGTKQGTNIQQDDAPKTPAGKGEENTAFAGSNDDTVSLTAAEIFDRRIVPIATSSEASSCTECHFGGVELKNYLREDQAATFAALRDEGLIDVKQPDHSKILQFINRHGDQTDPLVKKVRQAEYQAFRTWIQAAVRDPQLLAAKSTVSRPGNELPVEVIRHMRRDRVLQSFVENIWLEVGRCVNCHSPERNEKLVRKHGEQMSWIRPNDPEGTLQQCLDQGIIDTDNPEKSMILLKPLVLVEHGGGPKFALGSRTDKNFRRFLNDFAAVMNKRYQRKDQLPQLSSNVTALTGQHLRITELPAGLDKKLLKADIYRWTENGWSDAPWGTAENPINGKTNMWQSMVMAVAPRNSKRAEEFKESEQTQLPAGRYLVKIYIDRQDKSKNDRNYELGSAEFFGQVESDGDWAPGYQPPKIVQAPY